MKKRFLILLIVISFFVLPLNSYYRSGHQSRNPLSLSFNLGYATALKDILTDYSYTWGDYDYDIYETGTIDSLFYRNRFSGAMALDLKMSPYFGISLSGAYVRQQADVNADYEMNITWWDNTRSQLTGEGMEFGYIDIFPLSLNLFFTARMGNGLQFKLYGGATLFLVNYDLLSQVGWGIMYEDAYYYYPDWFSIDVDIYGPDQVWGGNLGIEFEKRYSAGLGLLFGLQYFFAPEVEYLWTVIPKTVWESEYENGILYDAPDIHEAGDITALINLSFLRIYAGISIRL